MQGKTSLNLIMITITFDVLRGRKSKEREKIRGGELFENFVHGQLDTLDTATLIRWAYLILV